MKRAVQSALRRLHLAALRRPLPARVALCFHAVEAEDVERFRECLSYWRARGYAFTDAGEFCAPGPGRRLLLSFDDSYQSWLGLLPALDEFGARATFFVNTCAFRDRAEPRAVEAYFDRIAHRGERRSLATRELRELAAAGHQVGCHGHSHTALSRVSREELGVEIDDSRRLLEAIVERPVRDFAFPFGRRRHFSRALRAHCLAQGFRSIASATPGLLYARSRPDAIQRTPWNFRRDLCGNLDTLRIDARLVERLTGRTPGI